MRFRGPSDLVKAGNKTGIRIDRYYSAVEHAGNLRDCGYALNTENKVLRRELKCAVWQYNQITSRFIVIPSLYAMQECPFDEIEIKGEDDK